MQSLRHRRHDRKLVGGALKAHLVQVYQFDRGWFDDGLRSVARDPRMRDMKMEMDAIAITPMFDPTTAALILQSFAAACRKNRDSIIHRVGVSLFQSNWKKWTKSPLMFLRLLYKVVAFVPRDFLQEETWRV